MPNRSALRTATPRWKPWVSVLLAWLPAVTTAGVFIMVAGAVEQYSKRDSFEPWVIPITAVCALLSALFVALSAWFSQRASSTAELSLRASLVGQLFHRGAVDLSGRHGKTLSLVTEAVERTAQYRAGFLGPIIGAMSTPLIVLGIMGLVVDASIARWLALLLLIVPVLIGGFQSLVRPIGKQYRESQTELTSAFLESVQALDTLVYARAAERTANRLATQGEKHRSAVMRMLAGNQILIFVIDAAFTLAIFVGATGLSLARLAEGTLTSGQALAIILLSTLVTGPVNVIGQFFYIGISGRAAQREVKEYLAETKKASPDAAPATNPVTAHQETSPNQSPSPDPAIVFSAVYAGWPDGPDVLRAFSCQVRAGESVALVGPSGIGKSTVSALIQGHLKPRAGTVQVSGLDVATTDPRRIRSQVSVVEQSPFLFIGTVRENLLIANQNATEANLWEALDVAGLSAEIRALPNGLDTQVGDRGMLLSGGQAQRLAIARAALRHSPILILAEPTSQIDLASEAEVIAALDRLAHGRTVLMIAHRPGALLRADRVIDMRELLEVTP